MRPVTPGGVAGASVILALLIVGTWFRFYQLDRKVYSTDEAITSLRIAGYTRVELKNEIRALDSQGWRQYQRVGPERGITHVVKALLDDVHPPLYFLLSRWWAQGFGSSVSMMRSLSAVISLLAFPCLFWLCRELFESRVVGWIAIALMAVSPFHVLYAQEARQYSLWTVTILLSSATLLRALRIRSAASWGLYTVTAALALHTHYLSVVLIVAHGLYVAASEGVRTRRSIAAFGLAAGVGALTLVPWMVLAHRIGGADYTKFKISPLVWAQRWLLNLSSIFFDPQVGRRGMLFDIEAGRDVWLRLDEPSTYVIVLVVALVGYALYVLYREAPRRASIFVSALIWPLVLFLVLPDVVSGGQRSTIGRYLIPAYVGIVLALAFCLAARTGGASPTAAQRQGWRGVMVTLLGLGVLSCVASSQADTWWSKYGSYHGREVARAVNWSPAPLVIVGSPIPLLTLSYLVRPGIPLRLLEYGFELPGPGFRDVFVFYPAGKFVIGQEREGSYWMLPMDRRLKLWLLVPARRA